MFYNDTKNRMDIVQQLTKTLSKLKHLKYVMTNLLQLLNFFETIIGKFLIIHF